MNYATWLKALQAIPGVVAAIPEVKALFDQAIAALHPEEQDSAKAVLQAAEDKSDQLHNAIQQELAALE